MKRKHVFTAFSVIIFASLTCCWWYRESIALAYAKTLSAGILTDVRNARRLEIQEQRYSGTDREGIYLINSNKIMAYGPTIVTWSRPPIKMKWSVPPPDGTEMRVDDNDPNEIYGKGRPVFYAYSAGKIDNRRFFVFLGSLEHGRKHPYAAWMTDDEVSWYYQSPIAMLSQEEIANEVLHRREEPK